MKRIFTMLIVSCGLFAVLNAQTALDPEQFVNAQITESGVYTVEAGQFYAFDGRIDLTFDVTIEGPDNGWIMEDATPPVLLQTPATDGSARDMFEIKEGGSLTFKNVMLSGSTSNGEVVGTFVRNTGGASLVVDNCVITDWADFALRNSFEGDNISVTNCVFINGLRLRYSQWGGFPMRMDVATDNVTWENNTVVNSGRLLANSGPFHNANITQMHNTYINQSVAGEEQRANEFMIANNIFYNYHFLGYRTENHSSPDNDYGSYFTTWNYFADSKNALDSISLYLGQNLFYRPQEVIDWFDTYGGDSLALSLLWEHPDVDSFIIADDNYTIGTNYAEMDPGFTVHPGNTADVVANINGQRTAPTEEWVDWRIESPVSFNEDGIPSLSWPAAFDLSYSNAGLQTAGTDGLPLGDLNWFPAKKAEYLTNRDAILTAIRDSMVNATAVYDPNTMDNTPMITEITVSAGSIMVQEESGFSSIYPNPVNQRTQITFTLSEQATVTLSVYNVTGQKVYELTKSDLVSGTHDFNLDASSLSSGMYVYTINATGINGQNFVDSKKMIKK